MITQVIGPFNSGTTLMYYYGSRYLNCKHDIYFWKHLIIDSSNEKKISEDIKNENFIAMIRHPYFWINSCKLNGYSLKRPKGLFNEISLISSINGNTYKQDFKNIIELWNSYYINYEKYFKNLFVVKLEDLTNKPKEVLEKIYNNMGIHRIKPFIFRGIIDRSLKIGKGHKPSNVSRNVSNSLYNIENIKYFYSRNSIDYINNNLNIQLINKYNYKLHYSKTIFFLHFHKAGGSSLVNCFNKKYNLHVPNINGNPHLKNPKIYGSNLIPFWDFTNEQFQCWVQTLDKEQFIAFEWNYFKHYNDIDTTKIELITQIRDPFNRFMATNKVNNNNGNYISYESENLKWGKKEGNYFNVNFNKYNYYVKMLNGLGDIHNIEVNETHLEIAKKQLDKFFFVIILEEPESYKPFEKYYNVAHGIYKNDSKKYLQNKEQIEFKKNFIEKNALDYKLYNYAKEKFKNVSENILPYINEGINEL